MSKDIEQVEDKTVYSDTNENVKGYVFNIQHYSIHDGPGIRTTVFLKGCPLRCIWCQNPESQIYYPEIFFDSEKCTGCGLCVEACSESNIEIIEGKSKMDRSHCRGCGKCATVCPNQARNIMGQEMTVTQVFKDVIADEIFYQRSGGGVTIGGGEPLAQPEFTINLLRLCKSQGLHTVIDTSGYANWKTFRGILKFVDLVLYDFKHMDPAEHLICTGVSNELILDNAKKICSLAIPLSARVPLIPGYNDTFQNIDATAKFIAFELGKSVKVHILPYHRFGEAKYDRLEKVREFAQITPPDPTHLEEFSKIFESYGLETQIGG
jgi:pyruvate formate lyase activating enzyme